jgi:RNA polymerase sigma-70 factor, ECF subfamily
VSAARVMEPMVFQQLFEEHLAFVWRVLRRHGVPERDLDDGCQEVFLVVSRRLGEFEGRSSLRTWLYGIAVRVALGMRRRAFRRRERLDAEVPETVAQADVFAEVLRGEAQQLLAAALKRLPRVKREVFVLYEVEAMTMAETAAALGIPENTALYRLYGARAEIQDFVQKREARARAEAPRARLRKELSR